MHAHTPPYTRNPPPTARKLYDETAAIAAAQDAKSGMTEADRFAKLKTVAHYLYHAKLLMDEALGGWRIQSDTRGIPAESTDIPGAARSTGRDAAVPIRTPITDTYGDLVGWTTTPPNCDGNNGSRIATPAKDEFYTWLWAEDSGFKKISCLDILTAEELKGFGIGDVEPATLRGIPDSFIDSHGNRITRRDVAEIATTVATSQHPVAAEALRDEYERADKESGV